MNDVSREIIKDAAMTFFRKLCVAIAAFGVISPVLSANAADEARGEVIKLGYLEDVALGKRGLEMKAKLDTGADTSSVFARDIEIYKRGEKDRWVRFRLVGKDGRSVRYNQNVIRFANIKTKTGGSLRRPVIHLPLCVGGVRGLAEINLADRSDFNFDMLIGREFLAHRVLVDSGQTYVSEASCSGEDGDDG
ncbi:MAG: RimK/LysX family protein [Pseudomonadota bacterium]